MSMASMVQNFGPNYEQRGQYNLEGYGASNSAALMSSHLPAPPALPSCHDHKLHGQLADSSIWQQPINKSSPLLEGAFAPAPPLLSSSSSSSYCPHPDDIHSSYMDSITRYCINSADTLPLHNPAPLPSGFDIDFPLSEENPLLEMMGLQRKLTLYSCSSYGDHDDHDLSQDSMAAAAPAAAAAAAVNGDEKESFLQANCSYGDEEVKLSNLGRSFTFPSAGASRESSCGAALRSPLMLSSENAEIKNPNNVVKQFNQGMGYRESSSAATTSCSNGDENELHRRKDAIVKVEVSEISQCMLRYPEQQGCVDQVGTLLNSRGCKQNKKRTATISNSNTSAKVARLETPPDVVHVRARRGQATDSHSLAERVRREKISQRMKVLQEIVPGCHKVLGKAMMLDEIINYVKSLQKQVEFLSMKLAAANQAGMPSMIANEVKFLLPNMEVFGDYSFSCQPMKREHLSDSLIQ